jgi:hypothetical protein
MVWRYRIAVILDCRENPQAPALPIAVSIANFFDG